jgi:hypothetical protein
MTTQLSKAQLKRVGKMAEAVTNTLEELFSEDLHVKRIESLGNATVGLLASAKAGVHAIGIGLAHVRGVLQKHAIKQVDRLFSNKGIDPWKLFALWVPYVLAQRVEAVVALDWTDFDSDDQTTLALSLITSHGRATPLVWKSVRKSEIAGQRANIEDAVIERFLEVAPSDIRLTLLADRGFADQGLFAKLDEWKMHYVIRMRGNVLVECKGESRTGADWVHASGRAVKLRDARVTKDLAPVAAVVCVHAAKMKEPWVLVTNRGDLAASEVVKMYGRRFTIEESFRDLKDPRFGFGVSQARISTPERRDRLLFVAALATAMLTVLGAAGDMLGYEKWLKANTSKKRTYSFLRQGLMYHAQIPMMKEAQLRPLLEKFAELMMEHALFTQVLAVL